MEKRGGRDRADRGDERDEDQRPIVVANQRQRRVPQQDEVGRARRMRLVGRDVEFVQGERIVDGVPVGESRRQERHTQQHRRGRQ